MKATKTKSNESRFGMSTSSRNGAMKGLFREFLERVGEDPKRAGLLETPDRMDRMYRELLSGYDTDPRKIVNHAVFKSDYDEIILVKDIEFYSLCEHHVIPFYGVCHVAYIPDGKIIGLSKIPRVVDVFSRRLQIQERLTVEIADFLTGVLNPQGLALVMDGFHLCLAMRGAKKAHARMVTSAMLGVFKNDPKTRMEFLNLIKSSDAR
ncbi:MAG: GTP cyclohydrolase I FolE [bacterium]